MLCCSVTDVMKKLQEYVDDINENIEKLDTRGPVSKYVLPDENLRGRYVLPHGYLTLVEAHGTIFFHGVQERKIKLGRSNVSVINFIYSIRI